jgi:hypothetical protein
MPRTTMTNDIDSQIWQSRTPPRWPGISEARFAFVLEGAVAQRHQVELCRRSVEPFAPNLSDLAPPLVVSEERDRQRPAVSRGVVGNEDTDVIVDVDCDYPRTASSSFVSVPTSLSSNPVLSLG